MEAVLRHLLPKLLGNSIGFQIFNHADKPTLMRDLPVRLRAYATFLEQDARILVVVDRDSDDCRDLKSRLDNAALAAGLSVRADGGGQFQVVNRIAIEELEAWYFGDWAAVKAAYPRVSATIDRKADFRAPDAIKGGTWEAFERVMQDAGYFKPRLRKIEAAQTIGPRMEPARNRSPSFLKLRQVCTEMQGAS